VRVRVAIATCNRGFGVGLGELRGQFPLDVRIAPCQLAGINCGRPVQSIQRAAR
jgi:hypothetical protein